MSFYDDDDKPAKPAKPKKPKLESILLPFDPSAPNHSADPNDPDRHFSDIGESAINKWLEQSYERDPSLSVDVASIHEEFSLSYAGDANTYDDFARTLAQTHRLWDGDGPNAKAAKLGDHVDLHIRVRKTSALKAETGWEDRAEPTRWLLEGIIPTGCVGAIVGASYELKTWLAMSIEKAAAHREPWLGHAFDPLETFERAPRVLHVNYDMPDSEVANRLVLLGDKRVYKTERDDTGTMIASESKVFRVSHPGVSLLDDAFWQSIEIGKYDLVVIDALQSGNTQSDEKDPRIAEPLRRAGAFASKHGTTFIFIHHSPKCTGTESLNEILRGSTAIPAALDFVYFVKKVSKFATKDPKERRSVVICKKMRGCRGDEPAPFTVKLTDAAGIELCEERRGKATTAKPTTDEDAVLDAIAKNPGLGGKRPLIRATGLSEERVHLARRRLLDSEQIENRGTATRPEYHVKGA